ncbi:MAG: hypothetical protein QM773_10575 [Hyphomonadaceae bacterium]
MACTTPVPTTLNWGATTCGAAGTLAAFASAASAFVSVTVGLASATGTGFTAGALSFFFPPRNENSPMVRPWLMTHPTLRLGSNVQECMPDRQTERA